MYGNICGDEVSGVETKGWSPLLLVSIIESVKHVHTWGAYNLGALVPWYPPFRIVVATYSVTKHVCLPIYSATKHVLSSTNSECMSL